MDELTALEWPVIALTPHHRHMLAGHCPAINDHKTWCCLPAGHDGDHGVDRIPTPGIPIGPENPTWISWTR